MFPSIKFNNDENLQTPLLQENEETDTYMFGSTIKNSNNKNLRTNPLLQNSSKTVLFKSNSEATTERPSLCSEPSVRFLSNIASKQLDIGLCELRENGLTRYMNLTSRGLYNYVIKCIRPGPGQISLPNLPMSKLQYKSLLLPQRTTCHRLGTYFHPRDIRTLTAPISSYKEPQIIVRRHVMLLNFNLIRAIVLRNRLLLLRISDDTTIKEVHDSIRSNINESRIISISLKIEIPEENSDDDLSFTDSNSSVENDHDPELNKMGTGFKPISSINFELLAIEGIFLTVTKRIINDLDNLSMEIDNELERSSWESRDPTCMLQKILTLKDKIKAKEAHVKGFIRALNSLLDKDEDMALMNLSRLISHPERYIHPISQKIIEEELDKPEQILESHLHNLLAISKSIEFLNNQISNSEKEVSTNMTLIQNRLLFIDYLLNVASICMAVVELISLGFGMNLITPLEDDEHAFIPFITSSLVAFFALFFALTFYFYQTMFKSSSSFF